MLKITITRNDLKKFVQEVGEGSKRRTYLAQSMKEMHSFVLSRYRAITSNWSTPVSFDIRPDSNSEYGFEVSTDSQIFLMLDQTGAKAHIIRPSSSGQVRPIRGFRGQTVYQRTTTFRSRRKGRFESLGKLRLGFEIGYTPKTLGGTSRSHSGSIPQGTVITPREVHHPGFPARDWSGQILAELEEEMPRMVTDAYLRALSGR